MFARYNGAIGGKPQSRGFVVQIKCIFLHKNKIRFEIVKILFSILIALHLMQNVKQN